MTAKRVKPTAARFTPPRDDGENRAYAEIFSRALHAPVEHSVVWTDRIGRENLRLIRDGKRVVGGLGFYRSGQWFGGRLVSMAGIAGVALDFEDRGRGLCTDLMRETVRELASDGFAISTLFPATQPVYRKAGYEQAGAHTWHKLPVGQIGVRDRSLPIRRATEADLPRVRALYRDFACRRNGLLDRTEGMWQRVLNPTLGKPVVYLIGNGSDIDGYAAIEVKDGPGGKGRYDLLFKDRVAPTAATARALLTFVGDHFTMAGHATFTGPPADPILLHLPEQCSEVSASGAWMTRIVDVVRALEARGYPAGVTGTVHLEIADALLPSNHGRFVLDVADGRAQVRRGGKGSARLTVESLAPLYTGYLNPAALVEAGRLEASPRDLATLARLFAGPCPWMIDGF